MWPRRTTEEVTPQTRTPLFSSSRFRLGPKGLFGGPADYSTRWHSRLHGLCVCVFVFTLTVLFSIKIGAVRDCASLFVPASFGVSLAWG